LELDVRIIAVAIVFVLVTVIGVDAHAGSFDKFLAPKGISAEAYGHILDNADKMIVESGGPRLPRQQTVPTPAPSVLQDAPDPVSAARKELDRAVDPRVIGGTRAHIEDYPWQVMLIIGDAPDPVRQGFCGGTLIRAQWVLTAAHCMSSIKTPGEVNIVSGSTYPKWTNTGDRVAVEKIIISPSWKPDSYEFDFAILKLERPVKVGSPVGLIGQGVAIPDGTKADVSGWGALYVGGPMSDILMEAELPVISNADCLKSTFYKNLIKDSMLCAGYREGGLDACQGDSGGPLVTKINGVSTLIGVVSWGKSCAEREKYGVYGRVSVASNWIRSTAFPQATASSQ
jgi:secreted trypsin-like serine protease